MDKESAEHTAGAIALFACAPAILIGWYRGYNQSILGSVVLFAVIMLFIFLAAMGGVSVEDKTGRTSHLKTANICAKPRER